jgi:hypothetical protein
LSAAEDEGAEMETECLNCDLDDEEEAMVMDALMEFENRMAGAIKALDERVSRAREHLPSLASKALIEHCQMTLRRYNERIVELERQNLEIHKYNEGMHTAWLEMAGTHTHPPRTRICTHAGAPRAHTHAHTDSQGVGQSEVKMEITGR